MSETETGVVKRVSRVEDEEGRIALEVVVHFYDGNCPPLTYATVWVARPVKIVEVDQSAEGGRKE